VLSQHTEPLWQFDVWAIKTDGRSQNAAIILMRQKPGQRGSGGCDVVLGRLEEIKNIVIMRIASHKNEVPSIIHLLFTFYMPMSKFIQLGSNTYIKLLLYADDTSVLVSGDNIHEIHPNKVQSCVKFPKPLVY
jgi:hypothetical protein